MVRMTSLTVARVEMVFAIYSLLVGTLINETKNLYFFLSFKSGFSNPSFISCVRDISEGGGGDKFSGLRGAADDCRWLLRKREFFSVVVLRLLTCLPSRRLGDGRSFNSAPVI